MATSAAQRGRPAPAKLRILNGRGVRKDGLATDSGGRPVAAPPPFERTPPEKPDDLSSDAEWLWDRVVDQMMTVGLLKPLDGAGLEVMCETFARWREARRIRQKLSAAGNTGLVSRNSQGTVSAPWVGVEERASKDFRAWAIEYGITPAAESHLPEGASIDENPGGNNPF